MDRLCPTLPARTDEAQALRYMGHFGPADSGTLQLLHRAEQALRREARPLAVWHEYALTELSLQDCGHDLARHLQDCPRVVLMAATLGTGVDSLLRRLSLTDVAMAVAADALASTIIEQVCDDVEASLRSHVEQQGRYLTGRYSPGYGDCPLHLQKHLCGCLDTGRKIGLTLTADGLMTPRKSVTAVLGVSARPVKGYRAGCGQCLLKETCQYRKRGTTCAENESI